MKNGRVNVNTTIEINELTRHYQTRSRLLRRALTYVEDEAHIGCTVDGCKACRKAKVLRIQHPARVGPRCVATRP